MPRIDTTTRWRRLFGPAVATVALILLSPGAAHAEPNVPVPPSNLISDDGQGNLSAADKDLVVKVRLAGLWEIPAGEMAQQKSKDPRIQEIGKEIAAQHQVLDALDRAAAKKLNITLPNAPNNDQQGWLGEMRDATGTDFDAIYIDRLRQAHGKIFPAIATVRATTRNDTVRKLAQQANQFVATHMTLLESSDIVDFQALPTAPNPSAATTAPPAVAGKVVSTASESPLSKTNVPILLITLVGGLAVGVIATMRFAGSRRRPAYRGRR
jgi:predicted outer membrane protein